MSEFVNYKMRGVSLPPGCKDLIHLPPEASHIAKIATDLFRELCGLDEKSEIQFLYVEHVRG